MIVYSIITQTSFEALPKFFNQLARVHKVDGQMVPFLIVANKNDLEEDREVSTEEDIAFTTKLLSNFQSSMIFPPCKCDYHWVTSAKKNYHVDDVFLVCCLLPLPFRMWTHNNMTLLD